MAAMGAYCEVSTGSVRQVSLELSASFKGTEVQYVGSTTGRVVPCFEYTAWPKRQAGFHMECVLWTEVSLAKAALQTGSGRIV